MTARHATPDEAAPLLAASALDQALVQSAEPLEGFRESLSGVRTRLEARFMAGEDATDLTREYTLAVDQLLVRAWRVFMDDSTTPSLALVAVGGYGRNELHPASDVDILILVDEPPPAGYEGRIESLLSFLWDMGLEVGNSVRSMRECVLEAGNDITVMTNLLEARLLTGSPTLFRAMRSTVVNDSVWSSADFFKAKLEEQRRRYQRFGDKAYLLEPNIKESPGGLRDLQTIGWVLRRHFGEQSLDRLVSNGILTESECLDLVAARNFLWKVRIALHLRTGRREDRLLFEHQRALATQFGYRDEGHRLAVERFMKDYYRTVMDLSRLNEMLMELYEEVILFPGHRAEISPVNARFQSRNGFLELTEEHVLRRYPYAMLEMFLLMQEHQDLKGVRAATIRLIRANLHRIDDTFRNDIRSRSLFLEILKQPRGLTRELRRMHRYGILGAYLPAFGEITGQMQHDLFHVYTVDEHSLMVLRNLRRFALEEHADELPLCSQVHQRIPKPELLYLAGLFHDIGKGRGGDHSVLGAEDARAFCQQLKLGRYDVNLVAWLVRNHLVMSTTAQRQDLSDPAVIQSFAERVGDAVHLNYLYLLTVADIRGTSPTLWNSWKDALLRELYHRTLRTLRLGLEHPIDVSELVREIKQEVCDQMGAECKQEQMRKLWDKVGDEYFLRHSSDEIAWQTRAILSHGDLETPLVRVRKFTHRGGTEVFIHVPDQDYLFATATNSLARLGLAVSDARIITSGDGWVLDTFIVLDTDNRPIQSDAQARAIASTLERDLADIQGQPEPFSGRILRQLKSFPIPPRVNCTEDSLHSRTMVEVIAADRPGLLCRIGVAMGDCGVRLQNARVATFGERAEDIFYVTDTANQPLGPKQCQCLEEAVVTALEPTGSDRA